MADPKVMEMLENYNQGLQLYKEKKFVEAKSFFEKALAVKPDDGPSKLYAERCEMLIENPPPADWDGVFTMTSK